jgi:PUA-domain protein
MNKKQFRNSEKRELNLQVNKYGVEVSKKDSVDMIDDIMILINNQPLLFIHEGRPVPTLKYLLQHQDALKKITVDMGAVKFVTSGADIMRPGITSFEESIEKDEFVVIIDETHKKPLAIGQMILSGEEAKNTESGKIIKNIHYIGDDIWNY